MAEEKRCTQCGAVLAADAPQGLCPACLLKRGLESGSAPSESAPPPTPADLAQYFPELEILELIGRGGMGAVYKARQKQLDRLVALKVLPASVKRDPAFAERFSREARALARLAHPNIVAVHEFGQKDGLFYFVMEFVDGMNLRQLLNNGKIAPKEALAIVPQICDALQYAHDKGIVHRDIKPENILLDKTGMVKIADFGLAKLVGLEAKDLRITGSGDVMGTPHYMAPEQVEHPQDVDHRADIYSLGVVFYQMLTGELPIGRFAPPSRKVQIDVRLDEVVLRALEKEPEHRYQHASEVKTQVETIITTPPQAGMPVPPIPADFEDVRRQVNGPAIGLMIASGLTLLILVTLLCGWVYGIVLSRSSASDFAGQPVNLVPMPVAPAPWSYTISLFALLGCNLVTLLGARRMKQLRSYQLAMAGSALAALPCSVLTFPFGVWALVVLTRREVRDAFQRRTSSSPRADRIIWFPLQSRLVREICGHMTGAEKREAMIRGALFGIWNSATWFGPFFAVQFMSKPVGWMIAPIILVVGLAGFPIWHRMEREFLCTTVWARQQGLTPDQLKVSVKAAVIVATLIPVLLLAVGGWLLYQLSVSPRGTTKRFESRAPSVSSFGPVTEEVLAQFDWSKLASEGRILGGVPVTVDGRTALKIENANDAPLQLSLLKIEQPPITSARYFLWGEIKYENVQGDGYLEMWNYFPPLQPGLPEGQFFSRTLAPPSSGPLGKISGTSSWRAFALPFDRTGTVGAPTRLEVNIFLPGRGVVFLGSVKLMQSANALSATTWSLPSRLSPFTEVVCHGDNVKVRFEGQEYELVSINDLTSKQILDYCRREFADRWEMRFAEDLVEVLVGMGRPMASDQTVKLELRAAGDGRALTVERALMTHENRHLVQNGRAQNPSAMSAVQAWLALMDTGAYPQSWETAANSFHKAVTKEAWVKLSEQVRQPLGLLISRKELSAQPSPGVPGGMPHGSYFVAQFETSFAALSNAVEVVEFMQEKDSQWKAISYLIRPRTAEQTAAVAAAQSWLAGIDAGHYAESWTEGAKLLRSAITQDKWVAVLETLRQPLVKVEIRTVDSTETPFHLPDAPNEKYVVVRFSAAFVGLNPATETVTLVQENDGQWKAVGYRIK
jgi:tRNA A-37 threonylcarbamoyl transferase component Bud32